MAPTKRTRGLRSALALLLAGACTACNPFGYRTNTISGIERGVFTAVNRYRVESGLRPLSYSAEVASIARDHSLAMARGERPFGHEGLEARIAVIDRLLNLARVRENVSRHGRGTLDVVDAALETWLRDELDRLNLEGYYQLTGVGAARAQDGTTYVTQIFVTR